MKEASVVHDVFPIRFKPGTKKLLLILVMIYFSDVLDTNSKRISENISEADLVKPRIQRIPKKSRQNSNLQ